MIDLIEDAVDILNNNNNLQVDMSACRSLAYRNKKLYVVDLGLDCVFILNKDGTESELFGSRGNKEGEFRDPSGLLVDDFGTMVVVDSRNHRLQLFDSDMTFAGMVEVDLNMLYLIFCNYVLFRLMSHSPDLQEYIWTTRTWTSLSQTTRESLW